VLKLSNTHFPV